MICTNNDFDDLSKINATDLSWSCKPDFTLGYYYIEPNTERIECEDLYKTDQGRFVIAGKWIPNN